MLLFQRTERAPKDRNIAETDPAKFAHMLTEKLERVLDEREKQDRFNASIKTLEVNIDSGLYCRTGDFLFDMFMNLLDLQLGFTCIYPKYCNKGTISIVLIVLEK